MRDMTGIGREDKARRGSCFGESNPSSLRRLPRGVAGGATGSTTCLRTPSCGTILSTRAAPEAGAEGCDSDGGADSFGNGDWRRVRWYPRCCQVPVSDLVKSPASQCLRADDDQHICYAQSVGSLFSRTEARMGHKCTLPLAELDLSGCWTAPMGECEDTGSCLLRRVASESSRACKRVKHPRGR